MSQISTIKALDEGTELSTSNTDVYTVPASTKAIVTGITLYNDSGSDRTVEIWIVPSGGTAILATKRYKATVPASGGTTDIDTNKVLEAGTIIKAIASANSAVSIAVYGAEVVEA